MTLFCEFKHPLATKVIYPQRVLQWVIKIDGGSTVDDDMNLFLNHFAVFICDT